MTGDDLILLDRTITAWRAGEITDATAMALIRADSVAALHAAAAARRAEQHRLLGEIYAEMDEIGG